MSNIDFYQTGMGSKFFNAHVPKAIKALEKIGDELEKINKQSKEERYKELLNNVIDHISVAESNYNLIEQLLKLGFEPEELVEEFNFCGSDVQDVIEYADK